MLFCLNVIVTFLLKKHSGNADNFSDSSIKHVALIFLRCAVYVLTYRGKINKGILNHACVI